MYTQTKIEVEISLSSISRELPTGPWKRIGARTSCRRCTLARFAAHRAGGREASFGDAQHRRAIQLAIQLQSSYFCHPGIIIVASETLASCARRRRGSTRDQAEDIRRCLSTVRVAASCRLSCETDGESPTPAPAVLAADRCARRRPDSRCTTFSFSLLAV
jgi:hypothetical protein